VYEGIKKTFEITVNEEPDVYLALQIHRDRKIRRIKIYQESYIEKILEKFSMNDAKAVPTPIVSVDGLVSPKDVEQEEHGFSYAEACGGIIWLLNTHPEIAFAVSVLTRYIMSNNAVHVVMMKRLFRYLKGVQK
jgi:hypothetical protein